MLRILIRHQSEQDALINNGSRRRLSFDPTDPPSGEIVIDYQLPTALKGATATRLPSPSSFSSSLASTTKRKFEETEEKEIAESYHKREMLVKGTPPCTHSRRALVLPSPDDGAYGGASLCVVSVQPSEGRLKARRPPPPLPPQHQPSL